MSTSQPKSLSNRASLYVAAIFIAILGMEVWREWSAYEAAIDRAVGSSLNLARSLRQHAEDTFELAEHTVTAIVYETQQAALAGEGLADIERRLRNNIEISSRLRRLDIYGPDGKQIATSSDEKSPVVDQRSYSYFQNHKASISQSPFLGRPLRLSTGEWTVTVSERLNRPDGSFGGVVVATLDSQYFAQFYGTFDVGNAGSIALATTNGLLLARFPYDPNQIGRDLSRGPLFSEHLATRQFGSYEATSRLDQITRFSSYDASARYPIVVSVSVSRDEVLAPWLVGAIQRATIALSLALALALLGLRLADQLRLRQRSEAVLAQKEAEFRLLAESASDLVERYDRYGRRLYISPAMERVLGKRPAAMLGTSVVETACEEDRPAILAAVARLQDHETTQETIVFRARHADGHEVWLETALRAAVDSGVAEAGIVGVTRDVTERKLLELKLESLATIDGLTGLANRRAFDEALVREIARARRAEHPVSLLMLDCDRFKRFNDDYGHIAGDRALKAIAGVLQGRARRAGDLAARYGGEELVLLLPDTDLGAARAIGGDICRLVRALDIPHGGNLPWMVATVSIGVATLETGDTQGVRDGAWLVATADLALYDAKSHGRNRCSAPPLTDTARQVS